MVEVFKVILKKSIIIGVGTEVASTGRDTMVKWVSPYPIATIL